jgi:multiple sugar transport system substrate-binding protein
MKKTLRRALIAPMLVCALAFAGCGGANPAESNDAAVSAEADATDTQGTSDDALTVATFRDDAFISFAAERFEETRGGVKVNVVTYMTESNLSYENAAEDYSQSVNTAIMSGGGEDIIDVSRLTWEKLADRQMLLDLNNYVTLNPDEIRMNILDAYLYNGKRYTVPLSFVFESYSFNEKYDELAKDSTLNDLLTLSRRHEGVELMTSGGGFDAAVLAELMFNLNYHKYVNLPDKSVSFDDGTFAAILENIKELDKSGALDSPKEWTDALMVQHLTYTPVMTNNGTELYDDFFLLVNDKGNGTFDCISSLPAINKNSKHPELAAEFISFLLSEEIQSSPENLFSPVNFKAGAENARLSFESTKAEGYAPEGFDLQKNIDLFNNMAAKLTSVGCGDRFISRLYWDEVTRYFGDEQTAEQTAANLQSMISTYLNE